MDVSKVTFPKQITSRTSHKPTLRPGREYDVHVIPVSAPRQEDEYVLFEGLKINVLRDDEVIEMEGCDHLTRICGAVSLVDAPGTVTLVKIYMSSYPDVYTLDVNTGQCHGGPYPAIACYSTSFYEYSYQYYYQGRATAAIIEETGYKPGTPEYEMACLMYYNQNAL